MANPIPDFNHNLVLPPHLGDPREINQLSPYPCSTIDLCRKLGTSAERRHILTRFLDFRERLRASGMTERAFQWLDGSFLEDIEARENRPPEDLDVVTVYWGYDRPFLVNLLGAFPEFAKRRLSKQTYSLDHFPFDAGHSPQITVEQTRYWMLLFSHNHLGIWKGMLKIDLNTPGEDTAARQFIATVAP